MKLQNIDLSAYPGSEKIYKEGKLHPIKVGMRVIHQYPTVKIENGKRVEYPNEDITVYDTSGLYTDPAYKVDINKGLPRDRMEWVIARGDTEEQADISSEYGRARRDDKKLDAIRFPVAHKPRKAKEGHRVTQMHYARKALSPRRWNTWLSARTSTMKPAESRPTSPRNSCVRKWPQAAP